MCRISRFSSVAPSEHRNLFPRRCWEVPAAVEREPAWASRRLRGEEPPASAGHTRDVGSMPGSGRTPGGGHGNPFQCSCLENPTDRGAWRATVHGVAKSRTQLKRLSSHTSKNNLRAPWTSWSTAAKCTEKGCFSHTGVSSLGLPQQQQAFQLSRCSETNRLKV